MSECTLLIIGAGGHGKAVAEAALLSGEWQRIAFADDRWPELSETFGWPIDLAGLAALEIQVAGAIAAVGNNAVRERWVKAIRAAGLRRGSGAAVECRRFPRGIRQQLWLISKFRLAGRNGRRALQSRQVLPFATEATWQQQHPSSSMTS